ncbi:MAG TPA: hypothetical protein VF200_09795 [Woeseiaceae bacterium]
MTTPRTAQRQLASTAAEDIARTAEKLATKKIWLPKLLYDGLPWFYLSAGILAFLATVYVSTWLWVVPHYLLFSLACVHLGLVVLRKRQRTRRN